MSLSRGVGLGSLGLSNSLPNLGGPGTEDGSDPTTRFAPGANSAWDFINNYARFKDVYYGPLANTPNRTFTRASTAYYTNSAGVLTSVASGVLRTGDRGSLIEGAGTNLCLQSQTFDNATWAKSNVTVTADAAVAPDGTTTADRIEVTAAASTTLYQQNITATATAATASIYVKNGNLGASDCDDFLIRNVTTSTNIAGGKFDWTTGIFTASTGGTATVTSLANGWYRITISISSGITISDNLRFWVGAVGNTETAGQYFYGWGAQLEATAYASSYIPTTTASATRAADSLTVTGVTGLDFPLSLYCEFERASDSGAGEVLFAVSNGTSGDRLQLEVNSSDLARAQITAGSAGQFDETVATAIATGTVNKLAARGATNDARFAKNGTLSNADATVTLPATPNKISFGLNPTGSSPFYGYLRRAAIFSRALSDGELQALTAA